MGSFGSQSGYEIRKNGVVVAYTTSLDRAANVARLCQADLGIGPDDDVDIIQWATDGNGGRVEQIAWAGCGWSCVDLACFV